MEYSSHYRVRTCFFAVFVAAFATCSLVPIRALGQTCSSASNIPQPGVALRTSEICSLDTAVDEGGSLIGGLLSLHDQFQARTGVCPRNSLRAKQAAEQTEAFRLALNLASARQFVNLNNSSENDSALTLDVLDVPFGSSIRDTCSSETLGIEHIFDLAANSSFFSNKLAALQGDEINATEPDICRSVPLLVMIGPGSSQEAARLSPMLSAMRIPHISYWASGRSFDDTTTYPYLFRAVPSNFNFVNALSSVIRMFGWTYVGAFASSDALYGSDGLIGLEYHASNNPTQKFCFGVVDTFSIDDVTAPYSSRMRTAIGVLQNDTRIKVIVLIALLDYAEAFLTMLESNGITDRIIIGSDDWVSQIDFSRYHKTSRPPPFSALIGLAPSSLVSPDWTSALNDRLLLTDDTADYLNQNPFLRTYLEERMECLLPSISTCPQLMPAGLPWTNRSCSPLDYQMLAGLGGSPLIVTKAIMLAVDAAVSAVTEARRTHNYTKCKHPTADEIVCAMRHLERPCPDYPGLAGKTCRVFDKHQSATPNYNVYNYQWRSIGRGSLVKIASWSNFGDVLILPEDNAKVIWNVRSDERPVSLFDNQLWPLSTCSETCRPGQFRKKPELFSLHCCWNCQDCPKYQTSNRTNADACHSCILGTLPNSDQTACVEVERTYLTLSNGWVITVLSVAIIGVITTLATLCTFYIQRDAHIIRSSDIYLSVVTLVAMAAGFSSVLGLLARPTDDTCTVNVVLASIWPLVTVSAVFVKTNRVASILATSSLSQLLSHWQMLRLGLPMQLASIALLTIIGEIVVFAGLLVSHPRAEDLVISVEKIELVCRWADNWQAAFVGYFFLIILVATVMGFRTRKLPDNYNDAKFVFMSSFCSAVVWLGLAPAYFITEGSLRPVILALTIVAQMWGIWCCLFLPRLYQLCALRHVPSDTQRKQTLRTLSLRSGADLVTSVSDGWSTMEGNNTLGRISIPNSENNSLAGSRPPTRHNSTASCATDISNGNPVYRTTFSAPLYHSSEDVLQEPNPKEGRWSPETSTLDGDEKEMRQDSTGGKKAMMRKISVISMEHCFSPSLQPVTED